MTEPTPPKRHSDPKANALAIHDYLDEVDRADEISADPRRAALLEDAAGLLAGISQGTIRNGQPRIADRLVRIAGLYPAGKDPGLLYEAIAACAEYGLTAENHPLGRVRSREDLVPTR